MFDHVTPRQIIFMCRVAAVACIAGLMVLMLGPFQGMEERFGLNDRAAHAIAFFAATSCLFLVAPKWRRSDIALCAFGFGVAIEILQGFTGRSVAVTDVMADGVGALLALTPGVIDRVRWMARKHPYLTVGQIRRMDRRSSSRSRGARIQPKPAQSA